MTKTIVVRTLATKLTDPITMYRWAKDMTTRLNKSKNKGRINTPTPITKCKVTIPMAHLAHLARLTES